MIQNLIPGTVFFRSSCNSTLDIKLYCIKLIRCYWLSKTDSVDRKQHFYSPDEA